MDIADFRKKIDELEDELVLLLNKRASYAKEIGKIKKAKGLPVIDAAREAEILDRVAAKTAGPFPPESIRKLFELIISETRKIEE